MSHILDLYRKHREHIQRMTVIRLHGPDRNAIEEQAGKNWSQVFAPKDMEIESLVEMVCDLQSREIESFIYVNNHFEGSATKDC